MFNAEEILALKIYCQHITMNPRPMGVQVFKRDGNHIWCDDWEIIEILKYLFNGSHMYNEDPPPNRLKNNPLWSKEEIVSKAEALITELQTSNNIINYLKQRRAV